MFYKIITLAALAACSAGVPLHPIHVWDANVTAFYTGVIDGLPAVVKSGLPEFNLSSADPFIAPDFTWFVKNLNFNFTDTILTGMSNATIIGVQAQAKRPTHYTIKYTNQANYYNYTGTYTAWGQVNRNKINTTVGPFSLYCESMTRYMILKTNVTDGTYMLYYGQESDAWNYCTLTLEGLPEEAWEAVENTLNNFIMGMGLTVGGYYGYAEFDLLYEYLLMYQQ